MTQALTTLNQLDSTLAAWRAAGESIAFVPTMGALHRGHIRLVEVAKQRARRVVVSIFVNPTQFGPTEDFSKYPRTLESDLAALTKAGVDAAWLPTPDIMYPNGFSTHIGVSPLSTWLCGAFRPGHFDGVATVVAKLFHQMRPDIALFGEKDYQQLCVIKRMVADLDISIVVEGVATVRESDGLALSSRNQYLSAVERTIAPTLHRVLTATAEAIRKGNDVQRALAEGKTQILAAGFGSLDYLELRHAESLVPLTAYEAPARLLVAAHLGSTRLIDNIEV